MNKEEILKLIKQKEEEARSKDITPEKRSQLISEIENLKRDLKNIEPDPEPQPQPQPNYRGMDVFHDMEGNEIDNIYASREYRNAWFESVRRQDNGDYVRRFISTNDSGTSQGGSVLVPTMLENTIEHAVRHGGSIISLCHITTYPGLVSVPYEKDSGEEGETRTEGGEAPEESEIELGEASLQPETIVKWISITKEMEVMAIDAFADYVTDLLVDKILSACDTKVLTGTKATKGLNGITTVADKTIVAELETATLGPATGFSAQAELDDNVEPIVVMNRKTLFNTIMGMKDKNDRPIFTSMIDPTTGKAVYYYNGMRVETSNKIKDFESATTGEVFMVIGNFKGYRANFPNGFACSLLRDPYTKAPEGQIRYIADIMAGGRPTKILHFCVVKKPAA